MNSQVCTCPSNWLTSIFQVHDSPAISPKQSKDRLSKLKRSTVTRSAVDLKQLEQMASQQPKMVREISPLQCPTACICHAVDHACVSPSELLCARNAPQEPLAELEDIKGMWWLSDDIGNDDKADASPTTLMDDIVDSEIRRCYSDTNLFQFDSIDVQAALVRRVFLPPALPEGHTLQPCTNGFVSRP